MSDVPSSHLLALAREVAHKAGSFLRENMGALSVEDISYKGHIDLVTRIDRESEALVIGEILGQYPDHGILAEESEEVKSGSGYVWVIDPLDGTTNFVHSFPMFCVSIAVCKDDVPVAGAIYAPCTGELFSAEAGGGAWLNGKPIRVSKAHRIEDGLFCTGFASMRNPGTPDNIGNFIRLLRVAQGVRRGGSAALELAYVGAGRLEGFWELNLSPWDVAAGSLIVREAGGKVSDMRGGAGFLRARSILATNGVLHGDLMTRLDPDGRFTGEV